jgi:hypothetical protein
MADANPIAGLEASMAASTAKQEAITELNIKYAPIQAALQSALDFAKKIKG